MPEPTTPKTPPATKPITKPTEPITDPVIVEPEKPTESDIIFESSPELESLLNEPTPKPNQEAGQEVEKVAFQYDRDTTIVAQVLSRWDDNTVDLIANTDPTGYFKTNVSDGASDKVYSNVRPGTRFDPGTYFPLPESIKDQSIGSKIDPSTFIVKKSPLSKAPLNKEVDVLSGAKE